MSNENGPQAQRTSASRRVLATILMVLVVVATVLSAAMLTHLDQPSTPTVVVAYTPTRVPAVSPTPTLTWPPTLLPPTATPTLRPTATPTEPCLLPTDWVSYTIQEGDTLQSLALRHGIAAYSLVQANCLSSQTVLPGQVIWVPPPDVTPTNTVIPTPCGPPAGWRRYTVERGDTLYSLARRHRTTVVAIKHANCLTSNTIVVGQKLWLPPLPPTSTPTLTATPTSTSEISPRPTPTPTLTGTPTPTATSTPTPTSTSETSPLPTPTLTARPTLTPTGTQTATSTETPTTTPTATPSGTHTATPTNTPRPTPTETPTATETAEPTATP